MFRGVYSMSTVNPKLNTKNNSGQIFLDSETAFLYKGGCTIKKDKIKIGYKKSQCIDAHYHCGIDREGQRTAICELNYIKINIDGVISKNQDKSSCITAGGHSGGNHSDMDLICVAMRGRNPDNPSDKTAGIHTEQTIEPRTDGKTNCLTSVQKDNLIMQLARGYNNRGLFEKKSPALSAHSWKWDNVLLQKTERKPIQINQSTESNNNQPYQQNRVYDENGIAPALMANMSCHSYAVATNSRIRRLTPTECARLQTVPDWYRWQCSETQQYKMLGNGWTVDVIAHIFSFLPDRFRNR